MRKDIKPGSIFPDFELPDHTGTKRKLSELQGIDPMILTLNRGSYCPKDRQFFHELVKFSRLCEVGYTKIVTVTTDNFMGVNELRNGVSAHWPFLYDEYRIIQKDLDIQEYTDPKNNPMIPYTFILEPGLKVFKFYNGYWYWGRPSMHELHMDLRAVNQKIRPDWQIDSPEIRKKFENNEKDAFFPYGKTIREVMMHAEFD